MILFPIIGWNNVFGNEEVIENKILPNNDSSPKFQLSFQRPSYILEKDSIDRIIYYCDYSKDECKINLNLVKPGNGKKISSTLSCKITTGFESSQFERCNPNTVIFPKGIHTINIKVQEKKNLENFSEYNFIIVNGEVSNDLLKIEEEKIKKSLSSESDTQEIETIKKQVYSGEVLVREYYSDEVKVEEEEEEEKDVSQQNTNEPSLLNSLSQGEKEAAIIPDFKYIFQRPSYVLDFSEKTEYFCDQDKDECKINFKLVDEDKKDISSKFECKISLSTEGFSPLNKCNPNTIIFPEGRSEVIFRVFEKGNSENFKEKIIFVNNEKIIEKVTQGDTNETLTKPLSSILTPPTEQGGSSTLTIPEFQYIFQRPSYILETDLANEFSCDDSKGDECKVNLKLVDEKEKDISSKFECEISLSTEGFSPLQNSEEIQNSDSLQTCNPNTIIFPEGKNKVIFRVSQKGNSENFKEKIIFVNNEKKIEEVSQGDTSKTSSQSSAPGEGVGNGSSSISRHYLPHTKIKVQGKIGKTKIVKPTRMTCYTYSECSINFTSGKIYASKRKGVNFYWDFGNGQNYSGYNPKSMKFQPGFYRVKLIVTDNYGNKKTEVYKVTVINLYTKTEIKNLNSSVENIQNFSIEKEVLKNLEKYSPENYKIISRYIDSLGSIDLGGKLVKWGNTERNPHSPLANSPFQEEEKKANNEQQKLLAKNIKLRVVFQKKNLKISGETFPESNVEVKIGDQTFTTYSNQSGEYELKINTLKSGTYNIQATVVDVQGKVTAQKTSAEKIFTTEFIAQLESYKSVTSGDIETVKNNTLSKNITLQVSLQKKNLKLTGTATPNSKIVFTIGKQQFFTFANSQGEYELKTNSLQSGTYKITASAYSGGKLVAQKSSAGKTFSTSYISKMRSYLVKKTSSKKTAGKKTKKFTLENYVPRSPDIISKSIFNMKIFVMNMFIAILSLILLFVILIKRKLI